MPLRAVVCLLWILIVTFGSALFVFQDGALEFLGVQARPSTAPMHERLS